MIDPDINELEALQALLSSDGWQVLQAHIESEYGALAYARSMDTVIADARTRGESPEIDICALSAAVRKVQALRQWPEQRVKALKEQQKAGKGVLAGLGMRRV